ncbi:pseudouridine synthase [Clostridium magnum]|uniref:Pseudouridine synthase n=1 Tax=Clostridium magnum DSM 2767 TaxID=1121326 RepID=A0A161WVY3_9CLOT|nr:pseudouridine synthase [Clostridium magnum]KZL91128.1 ribosomal large subunit pseudouridine synthase B [Clostridium magnum DSM 2767]SHI18066.1 23S rRNA pseudouridine2605 synthase [Clostridium magnum DSM 2767]
MEERLQKYMATCGVASRRKSEEIIQQGRVKVNGVVIKELGYKVDIEKDEVFVDNNKIKKEERKVYIALNKPEGYVCTVKDEKGRQTILDLVDVDERIYPIGRLDYDTSGLILLTNDGDVYNKIIHPREEKNKVYIALIKGIPSKKSIEQFEKGIDIGGYITAPSKIKVINTFTDASKVEIIIHEGKNRQIRRMCDAIGHPVLSLQRVQIGNIKLNKLSKGKWRFLNEKEIIDIRNM